MFAGKIARLLYDGIKARGEAIGQSQSTSHPDIQTFGIGAISIKSRRDD